MHIRIDCYCFIRIFHYFDLISIVRILRCSHCNIGISRNNDNFISIGKSRSICYQFPFRNSLRTTLTFVINKVMICYNCIFVSIGIECCYVACRGELICIASTVICMISGVKVNVCTTVNDYRSAFAFTYTFINVESVILTFIFFFCIEVTAIDCNFSSASRIDSCATIGNKCTVYNCYLCTVNSRNNLNVFTVSGSVHFTVTCDNHFRLSLSQENLYNALSVNLYTIIICIDGFTVEIKCHIRLIDFNGSAKIDISKYGYCATVCIIDCTLKSCIILSINLKACKKIGLIFDQIRHNKCILNCFTVLSGNCKSVCICRNINCINSVTFY